MPYRVQFSGELKPGVSKEKTIAVLSKLSNQKPQDVEKRFFRGTPVVIKSFETQQEAQAYQEKLDRYGIRLSIVGIQPAEKDAGDGIAETPTDTSAKHIAEESTQLPGQSDSNSSKTIETNLASTAKSNVESNNENLPQSNSLKTAPRQNKRSTKAVPSKTPSKPKRGKAIAAAALLIMAGVAAGGYFWLNNALTAQISNKGLKAENALYSEDTLLLGYANTQQLAAIEAIVAPPKPAPTPRPDSSDFFDGLHLSGIQVRDQIHEVMFSLNNDEVLTWYPSIAVIGSFTAENIKKFMNRYYDTTPQGPFLLYKKQDELTCAYSEEYAAHIQDGLLLISHPQKIEALLARFESSKPQSALPQHWQHYRSSHLASVGVFQPKESVQAAPGILRMMMAGLVAQGIPLEGAYMGIKGSAMPPSMQLEVSAISRDNAWLNSTTQAAKKALTEQKATMESAPDWLKVLMDTLIIEQSNQQITASVQITEESVEQAKIAYEQGLSSLMRLGGGDGSDDNSIQPESIDQQAKAYASDVDVSKIPDYSNPYGAEPQWKSGPLGITVEAIRVNKDGLMELELAATAANLPNIPKDNFNDAGEFVVTQVVDAKGKNLLREETCGSERNSHPAKFKAQFSDQIQAKKSLRLRPGVLFSDIANIQGHYSLRFADKVKVETIPAPIHDGSFVNNQLTIKKAQNSQLNFSAERQNDLLNIRALNENKNYLHSSYFGFNLGSNRDNAPINLNYTVQGKIGFIELAYAEHWHTIKGEFNLTSSLPTYRNQDGFAFTSMQGINKKDWLQLKSEVRLVAPFPEETWQGKPEKRLRLGPVLMDLHPFSVQPGFQSVNIQGLVTYYLPYHENLDQFANSLELQIDEVTLSNGNTYTTSGRVISKLSLNNIPKNKTGVNEDYPHQTNDFVKVLRAQQQISLALNDVTQLEPDVTITSVKGHLNLYLPKNIVEKRVPIKGVGYEIHLPELVITPVEMSAQRMLLTLNGQHQTITNIALVNDKNQSVSFPLNLRMPTNFDKVSIPNKDENLIGEVSITSGTPKEIVVFEVKGAIKRKFGWEL